MGTTSKHSWSRRDFLKGAAAGTMSVAALGALGGCSPQQSASTASAAAADSGEAGTYDVMQELSTFNRGQNASAKAPTTPEEYIALKGDGVLSAGGGCEQLGIKPADFMLNKPAWLGDAPVVSDIADTEDCDVLVIGAGNAGTVAALRCQEEGANVFLADMQTYDEYDEYACDMACYNSKLFLDKGTPEIDTTEVFNEYMRLSRGHAHQKIVRDYAMRSGEMLDWMVGHIPAEYVEKYAKTSNYKGNDNFNGECCGQRSWPAMTQWRDEESNINMWPFVIRSVHAAFEEAGGTIKWGYQGVVLVQDGDAVTGAVFQDVDGAYHQINAKAVVVAAGDFGGNPDMRLDLSDQMRNLAWSYGNDRTDATSIGGMGRDGSGIRMCMWAGGTMEGGPRAGQAAGINGVPGFAFGGAWPCFGNDGKRFMNETMVKHGSNGYLDMLPEGQLLVNVTDANWEEYLSHQGYGHETMDRSSDYMVEEVRENMANYKPARTASTCAPSPASAKSTPRCTLPTRLRSWPRSWATPARPRRTFWPRWSATTSCARRATTTTGAATRRTCCPSRTLPSSPRSAPRAAILPAACASMRPSAPTAATRCSPARSSPLRACTPPATPVASATASSTPRPRLAIAAVRR